MIEIKDRHTKTVILTVEADSLSEADLSGKSLRNADLGGRSLIRADFSWADLTGAYLDSAYAAKAKFVGAQLWGADLVNADLDYCDLSQANLDSANLRGAYLIGANLEGASFKGANLKNVRLRQSQGLDPLVAAKLSIVPAKGRIGEVWKKCRLRPGEKETVLARMAVPEDARRSNATGRKCRAEFVEVLEVIGAECAYSDYNRHTVYVAGETVYCHQWCEDRWQECAGGIHFFLTREEAEAYNL